MQVEAGRIAQFAHGRRNDGVDAGIADLGKLLGGALDKGEDLEILGLAVLELLQAHEGHALVLSAAGRTKADDRKDVIDGRVVFVDLLHLVEHGQGFVGRRADRQLHLGHQQALVLVRQEGRRQGDSEEGDPGNNAGIDDEEQARHAQDAAHRLLIAVAEDLEAAIEARQEAAHAHGLVPFMRRRRLVLFRRA